MRGDDVLARAQAAVAHPPVERLVDVDDHHHSGLHGEADHREQAHPDGGGERVAEEIEGPEAAHQREGNRSEHEERLGQAAKLQEKQGEHGEHHERHDPLQPLLTREEQVVLPGPLDPFAPVEVDLVGPDRGIHGAPGAVDVGGKVGPAGEVHVGVRDELALFRAQLRGLPLVEGPSEERERDGLPGAGPCAHGNLPQLVGGAAQLDIGKLRRDAEPQEPALLFDLADLPSARDQVGGLCDGRGLDAVPGQRCRIGLEREPRFASERFEDDAPGSGNAAHHRAQCPSQRIEAARIGRDDANAHRCPDSRRHHVHAGPRRSGPGGGPTRQADGLVQLLDQLRRRARRALRPRERQRAAQGRRRPT